MPHVEPAAMEALQAYDWPGNVRELQNYVERAVVLAPGDELTCDLLPETVLRPASARGSAATAASTWRRWPPNWSSRASATAGRQDDNLHAKIVNRVERELIAQVHGRLRQRPDQGRRPAGHQPQHAAQEAQGVRAGEVRPGQVLANSSVRCQDRSAYVATIWKVTFGIPRSLAGEPWHWRENLP